MAVMWGGGYLHLSNKQSNHCILQRLLQLYKHHNAGLTRASEVVGGEVCTLSRNLRATVARGPIAAAYATRIHSSSSLGILESDGRMYLHMNRKHELYSTLSCELRTCLSLTLQGFLLIPCDCCEGLGLGFRVRVGSVITTTPIAWSVLWVRSSHKA